MTINDYSVSQQVQPYWGSPGAPPGLAGESRRKWAKEAQVFQKYLLLPTGVGQGQHIYMTK
jgi:hypothetical protein